MQQRQEKACQGALEYKKLLWVKESIWTLILQVVEEPYLKALKEEYIGYGIQTSFKVTEHLRTKISKVINRDKVQLKKEVFIEWEQL